uniref:Uncharacterized protein n=1 Tax=uncultured prokaryote TaxID=198431 RepID=A0A0H5PYB4_9ZZZZ|nr:hypothetical protein [uncultured prokaryote]
MFEVLTRWSGSYSAEDMVTVMYFDESVEVDFARDELSVLWQAIGPLLHSSYTWKIDHTGRVMSPETGKTTALWNDPMVRTGVGGVGIDGPVSNASMLLLQWRTGNYVDGRELRGRSFIPGLSTTNLVGGEVRDTARVTAANAADALAKSSQGFCIWKRPKEGSPGSIGTVKTGDAWREMAVLRGRRG